MLTIRLLQSSDIQPIAAAFAELGWNKPALQYEQYLSEQEAGQRVVLVAHSGVQNLQTWEFAGYVTICWQSHYPPFREANIPEIVDFNVLPRFRRQGIGAALMDAAENRIARVSPRVGIGVGMTADYGSAQRMYVRRGYIPDGRGLFSGGKPVQYGQPVPVDDDLVLFFTKLLA
ncbi:MAG: GNAT family N-acetyltransferase [Chloroflexi bacterium HGW-Chloroflexi-6]|nr:MAG: GNAT family N-acetyltransferase [Chloroflexi bacterium HGW-Chloroflexi-6]